jgi:hypothetical protein
VATRTHYAHRYFAPLAKYFTVCITYQPAYVRLLRAQEKIMLHFLLYDIIISDVVINPFSEVRLI